MGKAKKVIIGSGVIAVLLIASVAGDYLSHSGDKTKNKPSAKASTINSAPAARITAASSDMNKAIAANNYGYIQTAATLIDLDNGQEYNAGEYSQAFLAASTAKLVAVIDYLHEVEQGKATLSQNINGISAQEQLKQMIEISDNADWANINAFLGSQQQTYAYSIGLKSFTAGAYNKITSSDEAKLLEELYQGKLINSSHRALLYSYMANTDSTNLIPAALPSDATVYNKYGELLGELHDAAIVSYKGHHFVLVVFTKSPDENTNYYSRQVTLIHAITKAAFNDVMAS